MCFFPVTSWLLEDELRSNSQNGSKLLTNSLWLTVFQSNLSLMFTCQTRQSLDRYTLISPTEWHTSTILAFPLTRERNLMGLPSTCAMGHKLQWVMTF